MTETIRRHREFTGPTPHAVSIFARPPNKKPAEHLILARRQVEDLREKSIAETKYNKQCDLKSAWERSTDKQIQKNVVKRKMQNFFQGVQITLEERREKLRERLLAEEESYLQEMADLEETTTERQEKMKKRATELKERRETERLKLVEDKLDQKFRAECEELRAALSKQTRDGIFADRGVQLEIRTEQQQREADTERFYAQMWTADQQAKSQREEEETIGKIERNKEMLEVLNLQKRAQSIKQNDEDYTKQLEADWLKEEAAMREKEEMQLKAEKEAKQRQAKRARDISIKLNERKQAKEKQEQYAMDMKTTETSVAATKQAQIDKELKKTKDREEMKRFMNYVANSAEEKAEQERLLNAAIDEEVENKWQVKDKKKMLEKEARSTLLTHVQKTRKQQIKEAGEKRATEAFAAEREARELHSQMEEHRKLEKENLDAVRTRNLDYERDLKNQIRFQRKEVASEIADINRELKIAESKEFEYQHKLKSALQNPDLRKLHPLRIQQMKMNSGGTERPLRVQSC